MYKITTRIEIGCECKECDKSAIFDHDTIHLHEGLDKHGWYTLEFCTSKGYRVANVCETCMRKLFKPIVFNERDHC